MSESKRQTRCCNPLFDSVITPLSCLPALLNSSSSNFPTAIQDFPSNQEPLPQFTKQQILDFALQAVNTLHLDNDIHHLEKDCVDAIFEDIITTSICTTSHIPRNVRPLLAEIMASELRLASKGNIWSAIRLHMLPKTTLGLPHRGDKKHRFSVSSAIKNHLSRWRDGDIRQLWLESKSRSKNHNTLPPSSSTNKSINIKKACYKGKEGHYGKAIQVLQSQGVAHPSNTSALVDQKSRHPQNPLPTPLSNYPATLSVSPEMISSCLSGFPKGSSPGSSNFRIQHLFEPICGSWAPASQECLRSLTIWLNHLLSGHPLLAPWLCGAPLTALHKKCQQGFRPIAVGEIFRRLASKICCQYIKTNLLQFFIPHGQLGVGIKGGLEPIIHSARFIIEKFQTHEDMCLLKLDFKNAFNECNREIMLNEILEHFPDCSAGLNGVTAVLVNYDLVTTVFYPRLAFNKVTPWVHFCSLLSFVNYCK